MDRQSSALFYARFQGTMPAFAAAFERLRRALDETGIAAAPRYNVELAFEEIVSNIVRHGSPTGEIRVTIAFNGEIVLTFEDDGVPFDPREQVKRSAPTSLDEAAAGGFGLLLVGKITTGIRYKRTGQDLNQLTLTFPMRPAEPRL